MNLLEMVEDVMIAEVDIRPGHSTVSTSELLLPVRKKRKLDNDSDEGTTPNATNGTNGTKGHKGVQTRTGSILMERMFSLGFFDRVKYKDIFEKLIQNATEETLESCLANIEKKPSKLNLDTVSETSSNMDCDHSTTQEIMEIKQIKEIKETTYIKEIKRQNLALDRFSAVEVLLGNTFEFLSTHSKLACMQTCRRWNYVGMNGYGWKHVIFHPNTLASSKCQDILKFRSKLIFTECISYPPRPQCMGISWIISLKKLQRLKINVTGMQTTDLNCLSEIGPQLIQCYFYGGSEGLGGGALNFLKSCSKLKELKLYTSVKNGNLSALSSLGNLTTLSLNGCYNLHNEALCYLPDSLQHISLKNTRVELDKSTSLYLSKFSNLRELDLWDVGKLTADVFSHFTKFCIPQLVHLQRLILTLDCDRDTDLTQIKHISQLELMLNHTHEFHVRQICTMENIVTLIINESDSIIDKSSIEMLVQNFERKTLTYPTRQYHFEIGDNKNINWDMIEPITKCQVRSFGFYNCPQLANIVKWHEFENVSAFRISSHMMLSIETIESIAKMPKLRKIDIYGTGEEMIYPPASRAVELYATCKAKFPSRVTTVLFNKDHVNKVNERE